MRIITPNPPFQIRLLGRIQICRDGVEIEVRPRAAALLLASLALAPSHSGRREALVDRLFPDEFPETGRKRLRQCLYLLRQVLGPLGPDGDAFLCAEREAIGFAPGMVATDLEIIAGLLAQASRSASAAERISLLTAAADLYAGEFLPGHFEDDILAARSRLQEQQSGILCELAAALAETANLPAALERAHQAIRLDRLREESHRTLMRLLAAAHGPAEVERQYRELERLLRSELGVAPALATRQLRDQLHAGADPTVPRPAPANSAPPPVALNGRGFQTSPSGTPLSPTSRLPRPPTRFYGRDEEMARIEGWLTETGSPNATPDPLVTITGPGGAGKTRLALEIAHRLHARFEGAVWFVSLEAVSEPAHFLNALYDALTDALGLHRDGETLPQERIEERLRQYPASLLVLDNFEHLVAGATLPLQELRLRIPGLACLVTSRQRLNLRGEREWGLAPLPIPGSDGLDSTGSLTPERLLDYPGVQLFVDRAQAARSSFAVTRENAAQVAAVCRRLDGLPLALELGAAWLALLSPQQVLDRLSLGSSLPPSRNQDSPERHRSLQAALDSSIRLLPAEHQRLFIRLSVFRDGWTLEAAEAVCEEPTPAGEDLLAALSLLAERSLVRVEEQGGTMRFRLLESMRHYGVLRAAECGETEAIQAAHARYFHQLAVSNSMGFNRAGREGGADVAGTELENCRAALAWLMARGESHPEALELASALGTFCWVRGRASEGRVLVENALRRCSPTTTPARLLACSTAGTLARFEGDTAAARDQYLEARRIAEELHDLKSMASLALSLCGTLMVLGDTDAAEGWIREAEVLNQTLQDPHLEMLIHFHLGVCADAAGKLVEARAFLEQSVAIGRKHPHPRHLADVLCTLGWTYREDDPARGVPILREGWKIHREIGHFPMELRAQLCIGALELASGNPAEAQRTLSTGVQRGLELRNQHYLCGAFLLIGTAVAVRGEFETAARLFGAAEPLIRREDRLLNYMLTLECVATSRAAGAQDRPGTWQQGAEMPLEAIVRLILEDGQATP